MRINVAATAALLDAEWKKRSTTQEAIAAKLGMSQEHLGRLVGGRFSRHSKNLDALCAFLGVNCIYFDDDQPLIRYPRVERCLAELMDGTRKRERAVVRLLRSAKALLR